MTALRPVARAVGSTAGEPPYRVNIRVGAHRLVADEPVAVGGGGTAPPPFGLLAAALAACTASTLRMYAARKGWELTAVDVAVQFDVGGDGARVITRTVTVPSDVSAERVDALASVAERTPVTLAVRGGTPITTTFRAASTTGDPVTP